MRCTDTRKRVFSLGAVMLAAACGGSDQPTLPDGYPVTTAAMSASERLIFATETELTAAADVVVIGEVIAVTAARLAGDHSSLQILRVDVAVGEALKGSPESVVGFEWIGWELDDAGDPIARLVINGLDTPRVGEKLVLWLVLVPEDELSGEAPPAFGLVNFDGILRVDGDRLSTTLNDAGRLGHQMAAEGLASLRSGFAADR